MPRSSTITSALLSVGLAAIVFACGSSTERKEFGPTGGEPDASIAPGTTFNDDSGTGKVGAKAACAKASNKAELLPLDVYVMLDQSLSMEELTGSGGSKWIAITSALKAFLAQTSLTNVSVGIQFFGQPVGGTTCSTTCFADTDCTAGDTCVAVPSVGLKVCGRCLDSCNAADYATPAVEIAPLPGSLSDLVASIDAHKPATLTPTSAALQGAVDHAREWADAHPGHVTIALFATDGDPSECDLDLTNVNAIAAAAANGSTKVLTFVIGVGSSFTALNGIAAAGGTGTAHSVDTSGNVTTQFLAALNTIRGAANGCTYTIPPAPEGDTLDLDTVNVEYTPDGGDARIIPKVKSADDCPEGGEAWHYDNDAAPTQILLCESACTSVGTDTTGDVSVVIGCKTVVR